MIAGEGDRLTVERDEASDGRMTAGSRGPPVRPCPAGASGAAADARGPGTPFQTGVAVSAPAGSPPRHGVTRMTAARDGSDASQSSIRACGAGGGNRRAR